MSDRRQELAKLLAESARKVGQENADKKQVERITRDVRARLKHIHASDEPQGECPRCGYTAPLDDFDNGPDESSGNDSYRTDEVTGNSGAADPDNTGDRPEVVRLKAKYAGKRLSAVDRVLIRRGKDPETLND